MQNGSDPYPEFPDNPNELHDVLYAMGTEFIAAEQCGAQRRSYYEILDDAAHINPDKLFTNMN